VERERLYSETFACARVHGARDEETSHHGCSRFNSPYGGLPGLPTARPPAYLFTFERVVGRNRACRCMRGDRPWSEQGTTAIYFFPAVQCGEAFGFEIKTALEPGSRWSSADPVQGAPKPIAVQADSRYEGSGHLRPFLRNPADPGAPGCATASG